MPSQNYEPRAALVGDFDARTWAGVNVFDRGASVTLHADSGVFEDALWFLNGRMRTGSAAASEQALSVMLTKAGAGAAGLTFTTGITEDDLVYVQADGPFDVAAYYADNALGFSETTLVASAIGGGLYRAVAQSDWTRGPITLSGAAGPHLEINDASGSFDTRTYHGKFSNVVEWLRTDALNDADEPSSVTDTLEYLDNTANGVSVGTATSITWGIDEDGHVFTSWPSSTGIAAPAWVDSDFRNRLGFTGSESAVTADGLTVLTAAYPLPGMLVTVEPLLMPPRSTGVEDSTSVQLADGSHASTVWRTGRRFDFELFLEGPASSLAQHRHYVDRCLPYWTRGRRLTLYPEWGDPRRRLDPMSVNADTPAYSLLHTSQDHGERGRLRGFVAEGNPTARTMEWDPSRIRTRVRQVWTLDEATTG